MAYVSGATEEDRAVCDEFVRLLEKSTELFNGLRDLPPYDNKKWQDYFGKTFDVFTRLWRFQQQHRHALDTMYGLKRWQVGEISSKIGQLYYNYYLRTSDTSYLLEAFAFYSAIRNRSYYSKASKEDKPDLMIKKLRYYARFVVVCLLLKKLKFVRQLIRELSRVVEEYINVYDPEDQLEWSLVLTELKNFVEADNIVNVLDVDSSTVILSHRLTPFSVPHVEKGIPLYLSLQEVLIVGNTTNLVKFSELTLDMFWMLQALEHEPQEDIPSGAGSNSSPAPGRNPHEEGANLENPHKYILYKPTFSQFLMFLSAAFRDLPPHSVMLLYISADGSFFNPPQPNVADPAYDFGGLVTNSRHEKSRENRNKRDARPIHCLHPGDLHPFLRKPLFLVIDSDNSSVFLGLPNLFGQPCLVLTSPEEIPAYLHEQPRRGSLFTLFLHSPLTAFCYVCNIVDIPIALWDKCQAHIDKFICESGRLIVRSPNVDHIYIEFYGDDFLRLLMLRFMFCHYVLRLHRSFKTNPAYHPHCHPPLPEVEVLGNPTLSRLILDLACILDVMSAFRENDETVC